VVTDIKKNTLAVIASEARQSQAGDSADYRDCRVSLAMTAIKKLSSWKEDQPILRVEQHQHQR
jgi:hypothetical protein